MPTAQSKSRYVELPDGRYAEFPAEFSDAQVKEVVQRNFPDAFKQPGPVSRFAKGFSEGSGLTGLAKAMRHPYDTAASAVDAVSGAIDLANPHGPIVDTVNGIVDNTKSNAKRGWEDFKKSRMSLQTRRDLVNAVPIAGPMLHDMQTQYDSGDRAGAVGRLTGTAASILAPELIKKVPIPAVVSDAVPRVPSAMRQGRDRFMARMYPKNLALTQEELAHQNLIKAMVPDKPAIPNIKSAASEVSDARAYAKRNNIPENGKLDAAKAMRGRSAEIQSHYDDKILKPHSGKFQTVPEEYNGEMAGNGRNQATLGQINERVNTINKELKSNFRKRLKSQTVEANASDADLNAEKGKLTSILHNKLAEMNGLQPEDIASVRQRAGKLRSLAEEMEVSADNDTLSAGRHASGQTKSPLNVAADNAWDKIGGNPEIVGNRSIKNALEAYGDQEKPLPQPVPPDLSNVPTTPEAAQQEVLKAHELETASQDAAAARGAEAARLRAQNVGTQQQIAQTEAAKAIQSEQAAQDAAAARNTEAAKLRNQNVDTQRAAAQQEVVKAVEGEQTAQDLSAERSKFADLRRRANVAKQQADYASLTDAQKAAAQQEFLKQQDLEKAAQDASAVRSKVADAARSGDESVAPAPTPAIQKEPIPLPASTPPLDTANASPAPKSPVPIQPVSTSTPAEMDYALAHPAGKITAIDQETGLPIVERKNPVVRGTTKPALTGTGATSPVVVDTPKTTPTSEIIEPTAIHPDTGHQISLRDGQWVDSSTGEVMS